MGWVEVALGQGLSEDGDTSSHGNKEVRCSGGQGGEHRGINVLRIPHGTSLGEGPYVHGLFGPRRAWEVWIVLKTPVQLRKQVQKQVPGFPTHLPKSMGGAEGVGCALLSGGRHKRQEARIGHRLGLVPLGTPSFRAVAVTVPVMAGGKMEVIAEQGQGLAF